MQWLKSIFFKRKGTREQVDPEQRGNAVNKAPGQMNRGLAGPASRIVSSAAARPAAASQPRDSDDFALSMAVGAATGSAPLGYLAGGSLSGAVLGSAMNSSDHSSSTSTTNSRTSSWSPSSADSECSRSCGSWSISDDGNSPSSDSVSSIDLD